MWDPNPAGQTRQQRRSGHYRAFVPVAIAERRFSLDDEAVAAVSTATKALAELNASHGRATSLDALARNLVLSEAVASSRIEGLVLSHKRLARAAYRREGSPTGDRKAAEVLGNVDALEQAIELGVRAQPISVQDVQDIHETLLRFTFDKTIAGVVRKDQNWVGGSEYHPLDAAFVPPPQEHVEPLLEDLCEFIERDDIAPVEQAAIAHAQFETLHPFADGNGRVGRALIYTVLRRRGEIPRYAPPISLVLASQTGTYISGLVGYREGRLDEWCAVFAAAVTRAAHEAGTLADRVEELQDAWLHQLGDPRSDAAVRQLVSALPSQPVIDVAAGQQLTGKSHVAVGKALNQLAELGVLQPLNEKKWGRVWECGALLDLVSVFAEQVSHPHQA